MRRGVKWNWKMETIASKITFNGTSNEIEPETKEGEEYV